MNEGQWQHLVDMTDMMIRFCRIHKDDSGYIKGLEHLRTVFASNDVELAKKEAHKFPMTGMTSFIDPRPLTPLQGETAEYCNLVFLTIAHAWIKLQTEWLFDGVHPNSPKALG